MKLITVLWALGCLLFSQSLYAEDTTVEYKIKAGYLYNFTKFVTWADDTEEMRVVADIIHLHPGGRV